MNKITIVLGLIVLMVSCKKEEAVKDYVTLSGTIINRNADSIRIGSRNYKKFIIVNSDGTFKDTLKVKNGNHILFDGTEGTSIYLKNGFDLTLTLNAKDFDESIKYTGIGSEANNYLAKKTLLEEENINIDELTSLDKESFDKEIRKYNSKFKSLLSSVTNLDSTFIADEEESFRMRAKELGNMYKKEQVILAMNGQVSPKFVDYENHAGGKTSLDDLKGKYVYIDMWATWCAPCKKEIPFLKEVEKEYHGKNIEFVSISVDRKKDYEAWKAMVNDKELGGMQLYADRDESFAKAYKVSGIPRFILVGPEGNIVSSSAPRPSDKRLKELFNSLNI